MLLHAVILQPMREFFQSANSKYFLLYTDRRKSEIKSFIQSILQTAGYSSLPQEVILGLEFPPDENPQFQKALLQKLLNDENAAQHL